MWSLLNTRFTFQISVIVCVRVEKCEVRGHLSGVGSRLLSWVLGGGVVVKLRPRLARQVPLPQSHLWMCWALHSHHSPPLPPNDWLCSQAPRIDFGGFLPLSFFPPVSHQPTLTSASFLRKMGMGLVILWSCQHAGHLWTQQVDSVGSTCARSCLWAMLTSI